MMGLLGISLVLLLVSGVRSVTKSTRVAYGEDVPAEEMPYFVTIFTMDYFFGPVTCGGTIIAKGVVLTAAHCVVDDFRDPFYDMFVMVKNGTTENGTDIYEDADVYQIAIPDAFYPAMQPFKDQYYGDIALLRINPNITKDRVLLPTSPQQLDEAPILVGSGKGLDEMHTLSKNLEFVSLRKIEEVPGGSALVLEDDHFVGKDVRNQDTCVGDSGGPLLIPNRNWNVSDPELVKNKKQLPLFDVQVGIVSYGQGTFSCGDNNTFGIYTDVLYWKDWIDDRLISDEEGWISL